MEASSSRNHCTRLDCVGATAPLLILLPPCILLLAIDIALRNAQRVQAKALTGPSEVDPSSIMADRLRGVASKAQEVLAAFKEYERQSLLQLNPIHPSGSSLYTRGPSLELRRCITLARSYSDSTVAQVRSSEISTRRAKRQKSVSPAFTTFCERLLQENQTRRQEKEIKSLKRLLKSSKKARESAAFKSFCDELLLQNELWRKLKEAEELKEEVDRAKRNRVGVVTRAAKQMVLDVQKDRLVEDFVKDVLKEAAEDRQALVDLREAHEQEIREMVGVWQKERRELKQEVEQLRIAHEAKALEQEIANELEDRLFESAYAREIEVDDADTYLEEMSVMSSSSTCVGTPSPSPNKQRHFRICEVELRKRMSDAGSPSARRKVDPTQFVGFSFNPMFFGNAGRSSPSPSPSPPSELADTNGSSSPLLPRSRKNSVARPTPLRTAWRV